MLAFYRDLPRSLLFVPTSYLEGGLLSLPPPLGLPVVDGHPPLLLLMDCNPSLQSIQSPHSNLLRHYDPVRYTQTYP